MASRGRGRVRGRGRGLDSTSSSSEHPSTWTSNRNTQTLEDQFSNLTVGSKPAFIGTEKENDKGVRQDYGKNGIVVNVISNYFKITRLPNGVFQYKLTFWKLQNGVSDNLSAVAARKAKAEIFDKFKAAQTWKASCWAISKSLDLLWSTEKLFHENEDAHNQKLPNVAMDDGQLFHVHVEFDTVIEAIGTSEGIVGTSATPIAPFHKLSILNAFFSTYAESNTQLTRVGAHRYFMNDIKKTPVRNKPLWIKKGFVLSTRPTEGGMYLNMNTATALFLEPSNLAGFMREYDKDNEMTTAEWSSILSGVSVKVLYQIGDHTIGQVRRVTGFGLMVKDQTFTLVRFVDGQRINEPVTVEDYFTQEKHLPVTQTNLYCVNVGIDETQNPKRAVWIPPEYLEVMPNQPAPRRLSENHVQDIIREAARKPNVNMDLISHEGFRSFGFHNNTLRHCGFDVEKKLLEIPGRILPTPIVNYGLNRGRNVQADIKDAGWNLKSKTFYHAGVITRIHVLVINDSRNSWSQRVTHEFYNIFQQQLQSHGIQFNTSPASTFATELIDYCHVSETNLTRFFSSAKKSSSQFAVIISPTNDASTYNTVKRIGDLHAGIASLFLLKRNINLQKQSSILPYLSNVAMKVNLKLGGLNHVVDKREIQLHGLDPKSLIIMGADVVHYNSRAQKGCPSIASVLGSVDADLTTYLASMRAQKSLQERIADIEPMVTERLQAWLDRNPDGKPEHLLFYRDGVGESYYELIRDEEIPAIARAWNSVPVLRNIPLKLTFVVVSKRHHTRFFPLKNQPADQVVPNGNFKPGLVVDREITHPWVMDFYLQPHNAIQGTARAPHYFVLKNGIGLSADQLQGICHALAYNHSRATKGISAPAPVYSADLCCARSKAYVQWPLKQIETQHVAEMDDQYFDRCVQQFKQHQPHWKQIPGPWQRSLDNIMFWM